MQIITCKSAIVVVLSSIFELGLNISKLRSVIEQKFMTFDHDFGYFLPFLNKEGRRKGEE